MVSPWLPPSFWQNFMLCRCLSRSVIFAESNNAKRAAYTLSVTRWLHATDAVCWRGKKTTYVHEGPLHLPTTAHLPCFISFRGKKSRPILFEQVTYFQIQSQTSPHEIFHQQSDNEESFRLNFMMSWHSSSYHCPQIICHHP